MKKTKPVSRISSRKMAQKEQPQGKVTQPQASNTKQNIKDFKMQIDYEIAKCLDTLDKKGIKYLKQTLKNSNVFNDQIKQIVAIENKNEKNQKPKPPQQVIVKNKQKEQKAKSDQIQQQIVEEYETFADDKDDPSKQKTKLGPNTSKPLKQEKVVPIKLQKFEDKIHQPLKPFAKRAHSRQGSRPGVEEQKAFIASKFDSKMVSQQQQIKDKSQIDLLVQKISQLPEQKLKKLGKIIQKLQMSQKIEQEQLKLKSTRPYILKPEEQQPNQSALRSSLHKNKKSEKATSLYNSIIKNNKKLSPKKEDPKNEVNREQKISYEQRNEQIDTGNQIDEQISQIELENNINQPKNMEIPIQMNKLEQFNSNSNQNNKQTEQFKSNELASSNGMGKKAGSQLFRKSLLSKNFPVSNVKKPLDIEVTQSHQADTFELNQGMNQSKMVRLGKKKLGTNKVKLILLRNRGHPSIIGLTCIQFYNTNGKAIPISLQNLKSQSSPKLLKLFNGVYNTINEQEMFTTVFKRDFQIELEIPEKIGGMKVWNYNKSEIQSQKQTDWIQLYINDRLAWEGLIKKGSYNQITEYCTQAQIEPGFSFKKLQKQMSSIKQINQQNQVSSSQKIKIDQDQLKGVYSARNKEREKDSKVNWLQKTLLQQKIKEMQQEDKQMEVNQFKKTGQKVNRFSQIYSEQQNTNSRLHKNIKLNKDRKQESQQKEIQINFGSQKQQGSLQKIQKERIVPNFVNLERVNRTNSQKIQQEKDIFSSFGQSLLKQKMKAQQINSKVNEINQTIQKLKQTYKKQSQLGFSSLITKEEPIENKVQKKQIKQPKENKDTKQVKQKKNYQKQSLDDFMNDSLFQQPVPRNQKKLQKLPSKQEQKWSQDSNPYQKIEEKPKVSQNHKQDVNIDDFLNQLNDLVGQKQNRYQYGNPKQRKITVPQLPKGTKLQIVFVSNWGDPQAFGVNKIQFFDGQGQRTYPIQAKCTNTTLSIVNIFSQNVVSTNDQSSQWKCTKKQNQQIKLSLSFSKKVQLSLIRIWNFIGDRVHSMIGIRKIQIIFDGALIFVGDIRKNAGHSRDQIFKSYQLILLTNNPSIQKKILQNDWLTKQLQSQCQQTIIFKKTTQNFMRPLTNGLIDNKQKKIIQKKQSIKLPKRNCFQYDPPTLPTGFFIKLILHSTWGDLDFIGLNGLIIYDEKGNQMSAIKKISQFPAPLVTLSGYEKDKRVINNLFDGKNLTDSDESIWLAPYLRDIHKMQKKASNSILIQFDKACKFAAINVYNYTKTPKRGVRQIEIQVDNYLVYRGYLRMANLETGETMTTINFTKDLGVLQKIGYAAYNQDSIGQEVAFYNQGKLQKPMF